MDRVHFPGMLNPAQGGRSVDAGVGDPRRPPRGFLVLPRPLTPNPKAPFIEKWVQVLFVQTFLGSVGILCSTFFLMSCFSDWEKDPDHANLLAKEQNGMKMEREDLQ